MPSRRYLVTGALGCVGAWTVKHLIESGEVVFAADLSNDQTRFDLVTGGGDLAREVEFLTLDVTDKSALARAVTDNQIERIVHLAALQVPASQADPPRGGMVNVIGTANVLDVVRNTQAQRAVFASSVAVYGSELAHEDRAGASASQDPETFYGVFKRTVEDVARLYHRYYQVDSIGIRPHTIYGPGRDTGLTSSPTWALLAAARGEDHEIPFSGSAAMQHASDVAKIFVRAAERGGDGSTYSIGGAVVDMHEFARMVSGRAANSSITVADAPPLPFPSGLDDGPLVQALGPVPDRPIEVGIDDTITHFASADSRLLPDSKSLPLVRD